MCEIKGHELWQEQVNDLARCKAICLTTFWCKGIDFGFNQCFLTREDVRVVGTKFNPMYTAYRVGTCSGDTLPINDHYLLKISFTNCCFCRFNNPNFVMIHDVCNFFS